jgi:hypothetical protein
VLGIGVKDRFKKLRRGGGSGCRQLIVVLVHQVKYYSTIPVLNVGSIGDTRVVANGRKKHGLRDERMNCNPPILIPPCSHYSVSLFCTLGFVSLLRFRASQCITIHYLKRKTLSLESDTNPNLYKLHYLSAALDSYFVLFWCSKTHPSLRMPPKFAITVQFLNSSQVHQI